MTPTIFPNNNLIIGKYHSFFLDRLDKVLDKHIQDETYNVEHLCFDLGVSRMQLHRQLRKKANCNTTAYIRRYRLKKAKSLLSQTDKNISEVAYAVGFNDPNYFSKCFKIFFGILPSDLKYS